MTGSMINYLMGDRTKQPEPEVGMGATLLYWTDREPATVIEVSPSGKSVRVQVDKSTRTDTNGMSESQSYTYERDPYGDVFTYTLRKNGRWVRKGDPMKNGSALLLGHRERYYDYSF